MRDRWALEIQAVARKHMAGGPGAERILIIANDYPEQPSSIALPKVAAERDEYERILTQGNVPFTTLRNETTAAFRAALAAQPPTVVIPRFEP